MKKGFTLLEIVVAVAILGVGVSLAMQIFSGGLKNIHRISMAQTAMNHAENVMNEILSDQAIIGPVELSGELDGDFSYAVQVAPWTPPESGLALPAMPPERQVEILSVVVDIFFKGDARGKTYRAVCLKTVSPMFGLNGPGGMGNPLFRP
jgi:general secretion pathway protein I